MEDREEAESWMPLLWCPNPRCSEYEKQDNGNVGFLYRYSKKPTQLMYGCQACETKFSLRRHTPLFGLKMEDETFFSIVRCLGEGCGVRETARIMEVKPDTVLSVARRMGRHVAHVMDHFLRELWPKEVQLDELWSFIRKKEGHLSELEALEREWGDAWIWIAYDPEAKVVLGFVVGKRTKDRAVRLLRRVREVLGGGCFPLFTSDELSCYEDALVQVFGVSERPERKGTRGRFPGPRKVPHPDMKYAVVHKERKGSRLVRVERRVVHGGEEAVEQVLAESRVSEKVNTSFVERENGKLRAGNGRLRRKTLGFSKERVMLGDAMCVTIGYDHFCRPNKGLRERASPSENGRRWTKRSPMMALGATDHIWSVKELALFRIPKSDVRFRFGVYQ